MHATLGTEEIFDGTKTNLYVSVYIFKWHVSTKPEFSNPCVLITLNNVHKNNYRYGCENDFELWKKLACWTSPPIRHLRFRKKKERVARFSNRWTRYFYRVHSKICRRYALVRRPFAPSIYVYLPTPIKVKLSICTNRLWHTRKFSIYHAVFRSSLDSTTFLPRLQSGGRAVILVSRPSTWSAHAATCLFHAVWHSTTLEVSAENVN